MMNKLAVRAGVFYEGDNWDLRLIHPTPVISSLSCDFVVTVEQIIFREDSFDHVTRVRRGRLYIGGPRGDASWPEGRVDSGFYHPYHRPAPGQSWTPDASYTAWQPQVKPDSLHGQVVWVGDLGFETAWRVIDIERTMIGHLLLTLRAISLVGVLPELATTITNKSGINVDAKPVREALDSLVDALHKQQPTPIVDVARETARVILSAWSSPDTYGADLGEVIKKLPDEKRLAIWASSIVNRLHPRGKSAEREAQKSRGEILRPVLTEDAETSVHLVGLLLREVGWTALTRT